MDTDDPHHGYWERASRTKTYTTPLALDELASLAPAGSLVLDAGCGYGRSMRELAQRGYRTIGVDFAHAALVRGRRESPLSTAQASALALPFADASFDAVVLLALLTCVVRDEDQKALMAEARRVLRPGGAICINDFLLGHDRRNQERYDRFASVHGTYGVFEVDGETLVRHHSMEWISALLAPFETHMLRENVFTTMNGNTARGFTFLGTA